MLQRPCLRPEALELSARSPLQGGDLGEGPISRRGHGPRHNSSRIGNDGRKTVGTLRHVIRNLFSDCKSIPNLAFLPLYIANIVVHIRNIAFRSRAAFSLGTAGVFALRIAKFRTAKSSYIRSGTSMPSSFMPQRMMRATCAASCRRRRRMSAFSSRRIEWS